LGIQTAECPIYKNHNPCGTVAIGRLIAILQKLRFNSKKFRTCGFFSLGYWSTFKGNRATHRPISFKDSTAFVSMGCFFVNSTQTGDIAKKRF
jgi:hypothetical protein